MFKARNKKAITDFSEKYTVSEKLVAHYIERRTDNDENRAKRKQHEYNDIDWEDLYHRNQLSSLKVGELELYINHHNISIKGEKDEKARVKAHILAIRF